MDKHYAKQVLYQNATILTFNESDECLEHGDLLICGDQIKDIGHVEPTENMEVIDCSHHLIMPGLVNAHLHSDENMFKGRFDNMPLELWMLYSCPPSEYGPLSRRLIYLKTMIGAIEMVKSGVTAAQDDVAEYPIMTAEGCDPVFEAYEDIGMRANVGFNNNNRHYCDKLPYAWEMIPEELQRKLPPPVTGDYLLDVYRQVIRKWNGRSDLKVTLSVSAPQRCSDDYLQKMEKLSQQENLPYHMHILETKTQRVTGYEFYNETLIEHVNRLGLLSPRLTIPHAIWVEDKDIQVMGEHGVNVVHNIVSNLKLGSGIMPIEKMKEAGVHIALGSDGMSSNDGQKIFEVMKFCGLIHKVTQPDYRRWITSDEVLEYAIQGGARSMLREKEIGSLSVGKKADFIVLDMDSTAFVPLNNIKNHLVYCENGNSVERVVIRGQSVVVDHELQTVDEKAIIHEIQAVTEEFQRNYRKTEAVNDQLYPYVDSIYRRCMQEPDFIWRFTDHEAPIRWNEEGVVCR